MTAKACEYCGTARDWAECYVCLGYENAKERNLSILENVLEKVKDKGIDENWQTIFTARELEVLDAHIETLTNNNKTLWAENNQLYLQKRALQDKEYAFRSEIAALRAKEGRMPVVEFEPHDIQAGRYQAEKLETTDPSFSVTFHIKL